jgi:hypothetical protein
MTEDELNAEEKNWKEYEALIDSRGEYPGADDARATVKGALKLIARIRARSVRTADEVVDA